MTRWLAIALTLIGFTIAMSVVGWVVNATVPDTVNWIYGQIGVDATLAILVAIVIVAAVYGWHDHRKAGTRPKGV